MNTEDIIRRAREAGFNASNGFSLLIVRHSNGSWVDVQEELTRFATLVEAAARADEREACAKVAERHGAHPQLNVAFGGPDWYKHGKSIAAAIRARKDNT
jgi:hypothetical protein